MEKSPYSGEYVIVDIRSGALIAASLTLNSRIVCDDLNTDVLPSDILRRTLKLSEEAFDNGGHDFAGLFDALLHLARSIVAASHLYSSFCTENPSLGLTPSTYQQPAVVYERVVTGLSSAFYYPTRVITDVLGKLEECHPSKLKSSRWFPRMRWERRTDEGKPARLWKKVHETGIALENALAQLSADRLASSKRASAAHVGTMPLIRMYDEDNVNTQQNTDEDAEGSTDEEFRKSTPEGRPSRAAIRTPKRHKTSHS